MSGTETNVPAFDRACAEKTNNRQSVICIYFDVKQRERASASDEDDLIGSGLIGHRTTRTYTEKQRERERETEKSDVRYRDRDAGRYGARWPLAMEWPRRSVARLPSVSKIDWRRTDRPREEPRRSIVEPINCYRKRSRITLRN